VFHIKFNHGIIFQYTGKVNTAVIIYLRN